MPKSDQNIGISERVEVIIKMAGGVAPLARAANVSRGSIDNWRKGGADPSASNLLALAGAVGVSPLWLLTGEGAEVIGEGKGSDIIEIPRYNASFSAGAGRFTDVAEVINTIPFRPEFFKKNLHRNATDMIIVDAQGDSMEPTMQDRDLVMIDTSTASEPLFAGVYAFSLEGALYIKRLQKLPGGIQATSDNKEYEKFMISPADAEHFNLIGRVVWVGRMM